MEILPKLRPKIKFADNIKTSTQVPKCYKGFVKNDDQVPEHRKETFKTNARTWNKNNAQANKLANETAQSNLEITKPVIHSSKTAPQASTAGKEQKMALLLKSKSVNEPKVISKLQPLLRTKSLGAGSDSGVSDSSDRILAWLADTSKINFKHHPVPNPDIQRNEISNTETKQSQTVKVVPGRSFGKQKSERKKAVIAGRVETNSETSKPNGDILNKLLPKLSQTHGKERYAPYRLTPSNVKHKKPTNSSEIQHEKNIARQTTDKNSTSNTMTIPPANQNGLSSEAANGVARNLGGNATLNQSRFLASETANLFGVSDNDISTSVDSVENVGNLSKANSLQNNELETQQFVPSEAIQRRSEVLQPQDEVLSMEEGVGSDVSIPLSESEVAEMEIDNPEEFAKEIVQEVFSA
jgi:hypothetical protein